MEKPEITWKNCEELDESQLEADRFSLMQLHGSSALEWKVPHWFCHSFDAVFQQLKSIRGEINRGANSARIQRSLSRRFQMFCNVSAAVSSRWKSIDDGANREDFVTIGNEFSAEWHARRQKYRTSRTKIPV